MYLNTDKAIIDIFNSFVVYDKETGKFFYKERNEGFRSIKRQQWWNEKYANKEAGHIFRKGYVYIYINKKRYFAHRVAFAMVHGYFPKEVDHIDGNKTNNSIKNLRECETFQNCSNVTKRKNNKCGLKGVHWDKTHSSWIMQIRHRKKRYASYHKTKEDAYEAYCIKSAELHKEFGNVQ